MITAIKEIMRQNKQQNQIKATSITNDQNSTSIHFFEKKNSEKVKIRSDKE